jgi:hypothetical protein
MVAMSDLIARAHFDDVMDGRVVDYATGASSPVNTAVFKIAIDSSIKGSAIAFAYAEFLRGGIPVDRMKKLLPRSIPMIVMLLPPSWDPATYKFPNEGRGLPPNETLLTFQYPAGVILESSMGIEYPFADDPWNPIFQGGTLDEVALELSRLAGQ